MLFPLRSFGLGCQHCMFRRVLTILHHIWPRIPWSTSAKKKWTYWTFHESSNVDDFPIFGLWFGTVYTGNHNPNWLNHVFHRGWNHQPDDWTGIFQPGMIFPSVSMAFTISRWLSGQSRPSRGLPEGTVLLRLIRLVRLVRLTRLTRLLPLGRSKSGMEQQKRRWKRQTTYMYVRIVAYIYIYIYINYDYTIYMCMYIYIFIYLPHVHTYLRTCILTYVRTYVRTYVHTYIHTYIWI